MNYNVSWYEDGKKYRCMPGFLTLSAARRVFERKKALRYLDTNEAVCSNVQLSDANGKPIDPPDRKSQIELAHEGR